MKGWIRLFMVLSGVWGVLVGGITSVILYQAVDSEAAEALVLALAVFALPLLTLYILGAATRWVYRGFRGA